MVLEKFQEGVIIYMEMELLRNLRGLVLIHLVESKSAEERFQLANLEHQGLGTNDKMEGSAFSWVSDTARSSGI